MGAPAAAERPEVQTQCSDDGKCVEVGAIVGHGRLKRNSSLWRGGNWSRGRPYGWAATGNGAGHAERLRAGAHVAGGGRAINKSNCLVETSPPIDVRVRSEPNLVRSPSAPETLAGSPKLLAARPTLRNTEAGPSFCIGEVQ